MGIAQLGRLTSLACLNLSSCTGLRDECLAAVAAALPQLATLNLQGCRVGDDGIAHLAALPRLRHVLLPAGVSDACMPSLVGMASLERVALRGCARVTTAGIYLLLQVTAWPAARQPLTCVQPGVPWAACWAVVRGGSKAGDGHEAPLHVHLHLCQLSSPSRLALLTRRRPALLTDVLLAATAAAATRPKACGHQQVPPRHAGSAVRWRERQRAWRRQGGLRAGVAGRELPFGCWQRHCSCSTDGNQALPSARVDHQAGILPAPSLAHPLQLVAAETGVAAQAAVAGGVGLPTGQAGMGGQDMQLLVGEP